MLKKKQKPDERSANRASSRVKVHAYYTLPTRGAARPEIDSSRRGSKKSKTDVARRSISGRKIVRGIVVASLVIVLLYTLRITPNAVVIVDSTPSLGRGQAYQEGVASILSGSLLNRTKVTFNRNATIEKVLEQFPEVREVTISTPLLGSRPVVHISEKVLPFSMDSNGVRYAISDDGMVVGSAADYALPRDNVVLRDESGVEVTKGSRVLRSDDARFFQRVDELLRAKGRVLEVIRLTSVPREAYLVIRDTPYTVRMYLDDGADEQMASLFSSERLLGERGERPSTYIDVRAGEKVFWQ